ncbi:D-alanyl-D-alanine carboxypeptidase family protein [Angustibacter aerolatus]
MRRALAASLTGALAALLAGVAPAVAAPAVTTTPQPTPSAPAVPVPGGAALARGGVVTDLPAGVPAPPGLAAASWLVADLGTGDVLAAKGAHAQHLPASTLKSLTALTLLPQLDPSTVVQVQPSDVVDGSLVGIAPGSSYTVQQLFEGMMLASGNDAATALARAAGGVDLTAARMQAEATELGARDTVVRNPSGLDAKGQVTSAYDLALVARAGMRLPAFRSLVATRHVDFPGKKAKRGKRRPTYQIQNHNRLLANYDGAIGVKNGYTEAARWTVVGAATRGGRTYVVTALRRTDGSWRPQAKLLDWAFAHGRQARPVGRLVDRGEVVTTPATLSATRVATATRAPAAAVSAPTTSVGRAGHTAAVVMAVAGVVAVVLFALALLSARARRRQLRAAGRRLP